MYARIARFEGGDPGAVDEQIAEMRNAEVRQVSRPLTRPRTCAP